MGGNSWVGCINNITWSKFFIDTSERGILMIMSTFEKGLVDDWSRYAGQKIAVDMLFELREETGITNSFGVIWNIDLPEWAVKARRGDFTEVECIKRRVAGVAAH